MATQEVTIRGARPGDRDALAAAIGSDATFGAAEVAVALELVDASLRGDPDYLIQVAQDGDGGAVVGYVCYGRTPMTQATWDLYWVVVHAGARGRGIAGTLIAAMEAELAASGGGHIRVETSETEGYGAARRLYDKLGYPLAASLPEFYGPGDALLTFYKRIAPR
jgi:ribosomal protein S18 acetylase RimI-like enzyme